MALENKYPLAGVTVIEFAQGWAGPLVGKMLAEFGAEVIKVESAQYPDWWRGTVDDNTDDYGHERSWFYNGKMSTNLG